MPTFLAALGTVLALLRTVLFALAVVLAVVCLVDWLVRTRRLSPFGPVARFFRARVDPLMMPVERRVVAAGGMPTSAPWWALAAVVIGGIVFITLSQYLADVLARGVFYASRGPSGIVFFLAWLAFRVLGLAIIVRVLLSWIPGVSPYSRWARWAFVLSEPILRPLRQVIPTIGMIDITPIVAYFLLQLVERFVLGALA